MREILFRGKAILADTPNTPGYWLHGWYARSESAIHIVRAGSRSEIDLDCDNEVWPETVGQYVGLKDMNGYLIFEGDILESPVKRIGSKCGTRIIVRDIRECKYIALYVNEYQIIGNIHDNPELIKTETEV